MKGTTPLKLMFLVVMLTSHELIRCIYPLSVQQSLVSYPFTQMHLSSVRPTVPSFLPIHIDAFILCPSNSPQCPTHSHRCIYPLSVQQSLVSYPFTQMHLSFVCPTVPSVLPIHSLYNLLPSSKQSSWYLPYTVLVSK